MDAKISEEAAAEAKEQAAAAKEEWGDANTTKEDPWDEGYDEGFEDGRAALESHREEERTKRDRQQTYRFFFGWACAVAIVAAIVTGVTTAEIYRPKQSAQEICASRTTTTDFCEGLLERTERAK